MFLFAINVWPKVSFCHYFKKQISFTINILSFDLFLPSMFTFWTIFATEPLTERIFCNRLYFHNRSDPHTSKNEKLNPKLGKVNYNYSLSHLTNVWTSNLKLDRSNVYNEAYGGRYTLFQWTLGSTPWAMFTPSHMARSSTLFVFSQSGADNNWALLFG